MDTMENQIALVTGANRGIGFETCRQLARLGLQVILTSRRPDQGELAAEILRREGLPVDYHPLDVTDPQQVDRLRLWILQRYERLDVLVNNAAVYLDDRKSVLTVPIDMLRLTIDTNYYGALYLCRAFVPGMKKNDYGRVVNVSSEMGSLAGMAGNSAGYRTSKAALNALTRILASEVHTRNIKVNSASPGWVRSDMGGPHATRSLEQGAETIVWLATLPDDGPTGGFFSDRKSIPW
jgi:NAD(P)-dependent dehydrogenase (short-subunit alcohol dehydrogenase family)